MKLDITQSNLYLLLPSKVAWLTDMMTADMGIGIIDAVKRIHSSETYRKLEDESTKMWHLGPVDLYQDLSALK